MASVFTYQEDVKRIHSPWSTPGNTTPQPRRQEESSTELGYNTLGATRLEPEKQDGPCEYKLHLLLRARRKFVSMTTTASESGYLHVKLSSTASNGMSQNEVSFQKSTYQPSPQTRQIRLQQLTTQLLWRLQQSSPFHSSSNTQLVLPLLPEATPRLGVPERPAKLIPGLEESQGALYELGVADDGTLIGLVEDEMEESLHNLRAMAASLGCVCDIMLKVVVGQCEWFDGTDQDVDKTLLSGELLVTEVLVRPDSRAASDMVSTAVPESLELSQGYAIPNTPDTAVGTQQLRIAFAGSSTSGKSSLVGTLTTSVLDNGRGKSRLSLLKHRHEIASGVTSSVAHELIGYEGETQANEFVVNYARSDVSSWTDIHNLSHQLCFLIDSPGLPRYGKSVFRSLVSWDPDWVVFCIAADESEEPSGTSGPKMSPEATVSSNMINLPEMSLAHLNLYVRLDLPIIVAITKMDVATRAGLRLVLGKVLSALKKAGRQPVLLSSPSSSVTSFTLDSHQALPDLQYVSTTEHEELDNVLKMIGQDQPGSTVPIVMTSAVSGSGLGKLHCLLRHLHTKPSVSHIPRGVGERSRSILFHVDEVFSIPPSRVYTSDTVASLEAQGVVLCGHMNHGKICVGDHLRLGPVSLDNPSSDPVARRSKSYSAQDMRRTSRAASIPLARSLQGDSAATHIPDSNTRAVFALVRVVSLRNLRLPVLSMQQGEIGTIGIELVHDSGPNVLLNKTRKGMVLLEDGHSYLAYSSLTATFPATDFVSSSPPLILGGHAIAYVNSVRAAVKVTAVALADDDDEASSPTEVFSFDGEDEDGEATFGTQHVEKEIKITFRFVSTMEWMSVGDRLLVVPTVSTTGPVAGPVGATSGLAGFVGRICELNV